MEQTIQIAELCQFSLSELRYQYPSEWIPKGESAQSFLEVLTHQGAKERYPAGVPEAVHSQIQVELKLIAELNFADYFLTIWDIVDFAKSKKILCQGRGSAANSVICYCLGVTAVDPSRMSLLFERFISVERGEPPDIDVDFEHERREEVLQYVYSKYGRERAGMVAAVITYRSRSAINEVSKVLGIKDVKELSDKSPEKKLALKFSEKIKGFPRHLSIHSGGFTLSKDPLIEIVPIEPARMEGRTIIQWDKYDLDALGLLKVDLLSLGMLSAIRKCCDQVGLTLASIPSEDKATYEMLGKADTIGVFQIESRAQMNMLGRLQPKNYYDLVIEVALVRPGPIVGGMVHPYLRRRSGLEPIDIPHPKLVPILERTLGVPLFQEQVMKISMALAGFTPGEADELRRAIGAWRSSGKIEEMGEKLMLGLLKSGLPKDFVERIFKQLQGFAEYGFPESHAASFALLAYASSYLKCHYPAQFTCALINSQPMGFYANHTLVDDVKRHGVKVLGVHPNYSNWDCSVNEFGHLQLGFRVVKGLSEKVFKNLKKERERLAFQSLSDFLSRTQIPLQVQTALALGCAFDAFGVSPRQAVWEILEFYSALKKRTESSQLELSFCSNSSAKVSFSAMSDYEQICVDYSAYRLSVKAHPMEILRRDIRSIPRQTTIDIKAMANGSPVKIAGLLIVRQRPPTAKGTVFATIEDEAGLLDLTLHKEVYKKYSEFCDAYGLLLVRGTLQRDRNSTNLLVRRVELIRSVGYEKIFQG